MKQEVREELNRRTVCRFYSLYFKMGYRRWTWTNLRDHEGNRFYRVGLGDGTSRELPYTDTLYG